MQFGQNLKNYSKFRQIYMQDKYKKRVSASSIKIVYQKKRYLVKDNQLDIAQMLGEVFPVKNFHPLQQKLEMFFIPKTTLLTQKSYCTQL